jgi:cyclohexanone monooxygenase
MAADAKDMTIDVQALQARYEAERDKRLQANRGAEPDLRGFANLDRDLYADPAFSRPALSEDVEAVVIGGGLAGLLAGAKLRENGVSDIRLIDKAAGFGGTWYWNRYPGAACDVESYIYLPLLEETGYMPSERYAGSAEIRGYLERLAARFGLDRGALFQTEVTELRWDAGRARWIVRTNRGDAISARFVVACTGVLSNPKLPAIPGVENFAGHSFHTSRWDYAYTGGGEGGDLDGLRDKTVGVIGTGATALQAVPQLARFAKQLYVFQRTPSSVDERGNRPTDPAWFKSLKPGWWRERLHNFSSLLSGNRESVDLVQDGWTEIVRNVAPPVGGDLAPEALAAAGFKAMERSRQRIADAVRDKATAEALKPYYHYFCKRPGFHDEYLEAFNAPNVTLIDTEGQGVERITPAGVVAQGREYPLDCLIYATGFDFLSEFHRESGFEVFGRGGLALSEHWKEGPRTMFAVATDHFPNFFFVRLPQAGNSPNFTHLIDEQSSYIGHVVGEALARSARTVEATTAGVDAWVAEVIEKAQPRRQFLATCTPGQYNHEGDPARERFALLNELYGGGPIAYFEILKAKRASGELEGLELGFETPAKA